jgi:L-lactate dehydrogenase complex protein LldG
MNDREKILNAIASNKPAQAVIPEILISSGKNETELVNEFIERLSGIGGSVKRGNIHTVKEDLLTSISSGEHIVHAIPELGPVNANISFADNAGSLSHVDRFFMKSELGVAENGAVWIRESDMLNRLLPFICQHLVIVLEEKNVLANMHEAYKKIQHVETGFHVFIAGPSKTADIEQSLVIGAHGARSMTVYLIVN